MLKDIIQRIIANVLTALYTPFFASVVMTFLVMFFCMMAKEQGWKVLVKKWCREFKENREFRKFSLLVFYTVLMLFRTLFNRNMWANPVSNVVGYWWIYNDKGELTTETIENLMLFIPFAVLLLWNFRRQLLGPVVRFGAVIGKSVAVTFLFSLTIEFLQLFLRVGTFQLSDLAYNTLGGLLGGLIYYAAYRIKYRKS